MPKSLLNLAMAGGAKRWRFALRPTFEPGSPFREPWATSGADTGRKAEAVGDNFCSPLETVVLETKGSFSAATEAALKPPSRGLALKWAVLSADALRLRAVNTLLDLAEWSSGEKTVSLVSGVPSWL